MSLRARLVAKYLGEFARSKPSLMARAARHNVHPEDVTQGLHELLRGGLAEITPEGRYRLTDATSLEPSAVPD